MAARISIVNSSAVRTGSTALLLMDFMTGIVDRYSEAAEVISRARDLKEVASRAGIPCIYVRVAFRSGHPDVSSRNKTFGAWVSSGRMVEDSAEAQIHPALAPGTADILVTKRRVSAFSGSDLEVVLRANNTDTLILAGVATSGVVLSTVREAADRDYSLIVVEDCCTDSDPDLHQVLVDRLFPRQAWVTKLAGLAASLEDQESS